VSTMVREGSLQTPPDILLELDHEYTSILGMLDASAAIQRLVVYVPELAGVETAFTGETDEHGQMVLHRPVNLSDRVEGLAAPMAASLGGQVVASRRTLWTSDYRSAPGITPRFKAAAQGEGLVAIVAVPMIHDGNVLGVLYGGNREKTDFGDRTIHALEHVAARMVTAQIVAERARYAAEVAVHEERCRLALDLHDTVGAMLFTLRAGIRRLGDEPQLDAELRARVVQMEQHAAEAAVALRGSLRALNAPPEEVALGVALRGHCRAFTDRTGINARALTLTDLPTIPPYQIRVLADFAREALLNAEKHAQARSVVVSVFAIRDGVAVTVADDGVGLCDSYTEHDGMGLAAASERLAQVGGTLTIGRNDDGGVTVQAWLPT
jgi:signal transduction histidine kinase